MKLKNEVYDVLKPTTTTVLPGLAALYLALAGIWHLPNPEQVAGTIAAVNVFLGLLVTLTSAAYKASVTTAQTEFDGTLTLVPGEDGSAIRLTGLNPQAVVTKNQLTFQVVQPAMTSTPPPVDPNASSGAHAAPMDSRLLGQ